MSTAPGVPGWSLMQVLSVLSENLVIWSHLLIVVQKHTLQIVIVRVTRLLDFLDHTVLVR